MQRKYIYKFLFFKNDVNDDDNYDGEHDGYYYGNYDNNMRIIVMITDLPSSILAFR